jgi:hypothetical protein
MAGSLGLSLMKSRSAGHYTPRTTQAHR